MIFDKTQMFFDGDAGAATASSAVDLGNVDPGNGRPKATQVRFQGVGMTAGTALVLSHCDTEGGSYTTLATFAVAFGVLNTGFTFGIPSNCQRYVKLTVTAGSGGTMTAGVVADSQMGF